MTTPLYELIPQDPKQSVAVCAERAVLSDLSQQDPPGGTPREREKDDGVWPAINPAVHVPRSCNAPERAAASPHRLSPPHTARAMIRVAYNGPPGARRVMQLYPLFFWGSAAPLRAGMLELPSWNFQPRNIGRLLVAQQTCAGYRRHLPVERPPPPRRATAKQLTGTGRGLALICVSIKHFSLGLRALYCSRE